MTNAWNEVTQDDGPITIFEEPRLHPAESFGVDADPLAVFFNQRPARLLADHIAEQPPVNAPPKLTAMDTE